MKITIDTKEDSHEDIRKVLQVLSLIIEGRGNNVSEDTDTTSMMTMFSDSATQKKEDKAPDFSSFLNLTKQAGEKKEEQPRIQFY